MARGVVTGRDRGRPTSSVPKGVIWPLAVGLAQALRGLHCSPRGGVDAVASTLLGLIALGLHDDLVVARFEVEVPLAVLALEGLGEVAGFGGAHCLLPSLDCGPRIRSTVSETTSGP